MMQSVKSLNCLTGADWPRKWHPRGRRRQSPPSNLRRRWDRKAKKIAEDRPENYRATSFTSLHAEPVQYSGGDGGSVTDSRLAGPDSLSNAESDDDWERFAVKEGEWELRKSPAPSTASDTSSESQTSENQYTFDCCPARNDTMDTQHSITSNMAPCQNIEPTQVVPEEWQGRENVDLMDLSLFHEDSNSEDEYTPSESSGEELDFSSEAEADAWLVKHFNKEEVRNIKAAWTWSAEHGTWIHHDEDTGDITEWPKDLV